MSNQGSVKSFNPMKGFGFIVGPDGTDIFLHMNSCVDGGVPNTGDMVMYDMEPSQQKPGQMMATNVSGGTGVAGQQGGGKGGAWAATPTANGATNPPNTNIWIGDLPGELDQETFNQIFAEYGTVASCRLFPPKTPGGNASGFVKFATQEEATWIVENLNGNVVQGLETPIVCNFGRENSKGKGKTGGVAAVAAGPYGAGAGVKGVGKFAQTSGAAAILAAVKAEGILGGGTPPLENQLFIKNLPPDATNEFLYQMFAPFGAMAASGAKAMMNPDGTCKGIGFVDFQEATSAGAACQAINGQHGLAVSTKQPGKGKAKGKGGF